MQAKRPFRKISPKRLGLLAAASLSVSALGWAIASTSAAREDELRERISAQKLTFANTLLETSLSSLEPTVAELSALPLLAEYLELSTSEPDSEDTLELKNYLEGVLTSGFAQTQVIVVSPEGQIHLHSQPVDETASIPMPVDFQGLLIEPTAPDHLSWLQAPVKAMPANPPAGYVLAALPEEFTRFLDGNELKLNRSLNRETGAGVFEVQALSAPEPRGLTGIWAYLFAIFSGLMYFLGGLLMNRRT